MANIRIHDLAARARARLGRSYQVAALAPYPARPALDLWALNRRPFVHPASEISAAFNFGADSNALRRLKQALRDDGLEQADIDALTNADVATDQLGVTATARALARLPAAVRDKLTAGPRAPTLSNRFSVRSALRHAAEARDDAFLRATYTEASATRTEQLYLRASGIEDVTREQSIPGPLRLKQITVTFSNVLGGVLGSFYQWSVSPPGIGEAQGIIAGNSPRSALDAGDTLSLDLDIPVIGGAVTMRARANVTEATATFNLLITVTYRPLILAQR
ncbi:MAG: hypothetical protein ACREU1_13110 [Burkholderiales bacterium]